MARNLLPGLENNCILQKLSVPKQRSRQCIKTRDMIENIKRSLNKQSK